MNDPKAAAAYHPGDAPVTRPDLGALIAELRDGAESWRGPGTGLLLARAATALATEWARADQAAEESDDWEVNHAQQRRARLAAERICRQLISDGLYWKERAGQAEQRIADAPHDDCDTWAHDDVACTCWKSAVPTVEQ